jgi:adenine-specific DNA-methyltransferase
VIAPETQDQFVPTGTYVLVKRFSAKEERRRIVAAVYDPARLPVAPIVAFENHLNYFHRSGRGLSEGLAKGLAAFLNCTLVDEYFRQRSGHTQVNATDLRSLGYPTARQLETLGARIGDAFPKQEVLDRYVEEELLRMASGPNPVRAKQRIEDARKVLQSLGLPKAQQNERSALVLLAILDLTPAKEWADAMNPLVGITPMMQFADKYYGKTYAPNTRETVRRQTVHQFIQAGVVVQNPDDPSRPINSGKNVYQIEERVLDLIRTYGTPSWNDALIAWLGSVETLKQRYARERAIRRIPVSIAEGREILLSPGGQNVLVKEIIDEFCPRFTPGSELLYVGDTDTKWAHFEAETLARLGVAVDQHGKMPDVVVYYRAKDWLVLIEAVTSHGPVDPKRRAELQELFAKCTAGLVYVTAFRSRHTMARYLTEISWETEVWVSDSPSHLIHFNGERFLGPY